MKNKNINNVQKYKDMETQNLLKAENCVEYINKFLDEPISATELGDVIDISYDKENKEGQFQEICEYLGVKKEDKKIKFWLKKAIKYYGLYRWCIYMQNKSVSVGE